MYDEAGQLVRENLFEDNTTIIYVYDIGGNIVSKTEYEYTLGEITENMSPKKASNYTYGDSEYKDLLTGYTFTEATETVNTQLTYDEIGNVTSFNGNTYTWSAGRQLESATTEDGKFCKYYYNKNGFLIRMDMYEDGGATYTGCIGYIWDGDVLKAKVDYNAQTGKKTVSSIIYDAYGENIGIRLMISGNDNITGDTTLLYRKNLQGDITGLINSSTGELVASYTYDAYGTPSVHPTNDNQFTLLSSFLLLGVIPQLYRGYVLSLVGDEVCYYLGSRFYSPKLGRFLNADRYFDTETGINGTNMYAYCNNNPVMFVDPTGEALQSIFKLLNSFVKLVKQIFSGLTSKNNNVTEDNPCDIVPGETVSVYADVYWFCCEVAGATDINISVTTKNVTIVIYKKKVIGKEQLHFSNSNNLTYLAKESYKNKYLVYVSAPGKASITCSMKQHVDTYTNQNGALWSLNNDTPRPNLLQSPKNYWYVDKDHLEVLFVFLIENNMLDNYEDFSGDSAAVAEFLSGFFVGPKLGLAVDIFFTLTDIFVGSEIKSYKEQLLESICDAGNYNYKRQRFENGVLLKEIFDISSGKYFYYVESWYGPTMYGESGYCGTWTNNKYAEP